MSLFANCRSQFLLDRLGRCLKLFVSTVIPSSHEFASQFGLVIIIIMYLCSKLNGKFNGIWVYEVHWNMTNNEYNYENCEIIWEVGFREESCPSGKVLD